MIGTEYAAKCMKCGTEYRIRQGGGSEFHDLHCDQCGQHKMVRFCEVGELHVRFLKGMPPGWFNVTTGESDLHFKQTHPGESIDSEEYKQGVEEHAGACKCGGRFRVNAPARCPKCRSEEHDICWEYLRPYD
jgi:DNA-directed RNA polymerase subunit RPC12/RpoP